jgi:hypothetical protein
MASIETVPANLDWIKVQSESLINSAFASLRDGVEEDIKSYNAMLKLPPTHEIRISSQITTIFVVARIDAHVEFQRRGNSVEIRQGGEPPLLVTPIFSNLGRCRWKFNEEELEQWQVRKMALEELLFPPQFGMW